MKESLNLDIPIIIHDYAKIYINSNFRWKKNWVNFFGDFPYLEAGKSNNHCSDIFVNNLENTCESNMRKIRPGIYVSMNSFYDKKLKLRLSFCQNGTFKIETKNACIEWIPWILQIVLLKNGASLVHAAAVEKDGNVLLLPGWSNTGKTIITIFLIKEYNMNYLGEDYVIIDKKGRCYTFPIQMTLHEKHLSLLSEKIQSLKKPILPRYVCNKIENYSSIIKKKIKNIPKLLQILRRYNVYTVKVRPSEIFSYNNMSYVGRLSKIVWLEREEGSCGIELIHCKFDITSRMLGCTVADWDPWCTYVILSLIGEELVNYNILFNKWIDVLNEATSLSEYFLLKLPRDYDLNEIAECIMA